MSYLMIYAYKTQEIASCKTLDTLMVFLKDFFEKVDFEKNNQQMTKEVCKSSQGAKSYEQKYHVQINKRL